MLTFIFLFLRYTRLYSLVKLTKFDIFTFIRDNIIEILSEKLQSCAGSCMCFNTDF